MPRPPKPAAEKASVVVTLRFTPAQAALLDRMARWRNLDRAEFIRTTMRDYRAAAADRCRHRGEAGECGRCGYYREPAAT